MIPLASYRVIGKPKISATIIVEVITTEEGRLVARVSRGRGSAIGLAIGRYNAHDAQKQDEIYFFHKSECSVSLILRGRKVFFQYLKNTASDP